MQIVQFRQIIVPLFFLKHASDVCTRDNFHYAMVVVGAYMADMMQCNRSCVLGGTMHNSVASIIAAATFSCAPSVCVMALNHNRKSPLLSS
jgi:hypothetical protein